MTDYSRATSRTSLSIGSCPTGTPVSTKITAPKILVIGDSWTKDITNGPDFAGWMYPVQLMANASGLSITWIGDLHSGLSPANNHRAVAGTRLTQHMSGGANDDVAYVSGLSAGNRPDIIWIYFSGANETIVGGTDVSAYGSHLETLVGQFEAIQSFRYVLASGVRLNGASNANALADETSMRAQTRTAVTNLQGSGKLVAYADANVVQATSSFAGGHVEDVGSWLHAKAIGQMFVAHAFWPVLLNISGRNACWPGDAAG